MRKQIFTLMMCMMTLGLLNAQTVIFDPATVDEGTLPAGMSIVDTLDGTYLQVIVNGWDTKLDIPKVENIEGNMFTASVGFGQLDPSDAKVLAVQCMDTVNLMPNWDGSAMEPSTCSLNQNPAEDGFVKRKGAMHENMVFVHQIQFFGQETTTWGPTVGDTIWCGKITSFDASVLLDAAMLDPSTLPTGFEIVDEGGKKLLKATLDEWNQILTIDNFEILKNNKMILHDMKYDKGGTSYEAAGVKVHYEMKYNDVSKGLYEFDPPAMTTLYTDTADITMNDTVNQIQFAVMETTDWSAIKDAYLYVGKISVIFADKVPAVAPETGEIAFTSAAITLDGILDDAYAPFDGYPVTKIALNETGNDVIPADQSSGTWYSCGDTENFYFFIVVKDNDPIDMAVTSTAPWNNDGVELFLDMQNRRYIGGSRISNEQHQIRINLGTDSPLTGDVGSLTNQGMPGFFGDSDTTNITYVISKGSNGYDVEVVVPWATWFRTNSNTNLDALDSVASASFKGRKVAFEVSLIDASAADTRVSILNWANPTEKDIAYLYNEHYGELTLTGDWITGIKEAAYNYELLHVYPNPTNSMLTVEMENMKNVEVYNILGAKMIDSEMISRQLDVSDLASGIYFIKATDTNGKLAVTKFAKN